MKFLRDLSLKGKLVLITAGTATTALLLSSVMILVNQAFGYRDDLAAQLVTVAHAIGTNNVTSITFEDERMGGQALAALQTEPAFLLANLYNARGNRIASYARDADDDALVFEPALLVAAVDSGETITSFRGFRYVDVIEPVVYEDELVGFVHVRGSLDSVAARLVRSSLFVIAATMIAVLFAVLTSIRLQSVVLRPIHELVSLTRKVREHGNYSARLDYSSQDEIGALVRGFHDMLQQLGERDRVLQENRKSLAERSESLSAANEELRRVVDQSVQAMQEAKAASRAKSEFLARMSHEIRTPMNGVIGMLELLARTRLNNDQRHYVKTIDQSAETLLAVINDILDFSKIEAGKLIIDERDLNVRECVESVVELLASRAHEKDVEIVCHIDNASDLNVRGDGIRLRQILMNLVGNAIKFTERGEIKVAVRTLSDEDGTATLEFSVVDSGIGIEEDSLQRIFDSFTQQDGSTTRRFGGTGLGLTISRELVQLMGGTIGVESTPGKGSRFWFEIPFPVLSRQKISKLIGRLAERRVLVVDDNATNRDMLTRQLLGWDMEPVTVESSASALSALETSTQHDRPFDLILLDWHMPNVDGVMFAGELGRHAEYSSIPIILLTSASVAEILAEHGDAHVDAFITKPVRQARLRDEMIRVLSAQAGSAEIETDQLETEEPLQGLSVLLVEDNRINQEVARGMLASLDIRVELANDGAEALDKLEAGRFDIVLMDCQMPVMDGFQATTEIREREAGTGERQVIVALTANALPEDRERCLAAGMDDFLSKPFTLDRLRDVLVRAGGEQRRSA